jgi:polyhydroxyalkanoate synthesis regulator protein
MHHWIITFHRHRNAARAVLYDEFVNLKSIDELRAWAAQGVKFVVVDSETGEDVTRILLA